MQLNWFRRKHRVEDIDAEIRHHLDEAIRERMARGETPEEARLNALREFGNVALVREITREMWGWTLFERLMQDLRFALRMFRKNPGFSFVAILTLALGIGANTAIFSVIYAVMLSPLPYPDSEKLVGLRIRANEGGAERRLTAPEWMASKDRREVFVQAAAFESKEFTLTGNGEADTLKAVRVSEELLPMLGIQPRRGRLFSAEEFQPGRSQVVLISQRLWQNRFGSDEQIIGRAATLDEQSFIIVGVLPAGFDFFPSTDLLLPLALDADQHGNRLAGIYEVVARLRAEVDLEQAQRSLNGAISQFDQAVGMRVSSLRTMLARDFQQSLLLLWGAVGFVLLIACANFANLLLARSANRQKELVIRSALGASRSRLVRQLLTESVLLALLGGAAGLLIAYWVVQAIIAAGPSSLSFVRMDAVARPIPRLGQTQINVGVIAFTSGISLLTGLIFGLIPALHFSRPNLNRSLKEGAAISDTGFGLWKHQRTQSLLIVTEIALALVLLIGAGLLVKSFAGLKRIAPGAEPEKILIIQLQFPWYRFRSHEQMLAFVTRVSERVRAFPTVRRVSATSSLPLSEGADIRYFNLEKLPDALPPDDLPQEAMPPPPPQSGEARKAMPWAHTVNIAPDYFQAMGIAIQRGREFHLHDNLDATSVVVINQTMAARYWPNADPVGQRLQLGGPRAPWAIIVGVVANSRQLAREEKARPMLYRPLLQSIRRMTDLSTADAHKREVDYISLVVRTTDRAESLMNAVQKEVRILDPQQPILRIASMEEILGHVDALPRFNLFLFGALAVLALTLAAVGIYGVMSYSVAQRTREFGIRLALGAQSRDIVRLVLRQGITLLLFGITSGLAVAFALTTLMTKLLYGVSAIDPLTIGEMVLLLAGISLLACYFPARRAIKVDPLVALRQE